MRLLCSRVGLLEWGGLRGALGTCSSLAFAGTLISPSASEGALQCIARSSLKHHLFASTVLAASEPTAHTQPHLIEVQLPGTARCHMCHVQRNAQMRREAVSVLRGEGPHLSLSWEVSCWQPRWHIGSMNTLLTSPRLPSTQPQSTVLECLEVLWRTKKEE